MSLFQSLPLQHRFWVEFYQVAQAKDEHIFQDVQKQVEYNILSELAKRTALRCTKIIGESVTFCTFYYNKLIAVTKETPRKSFMLWIWPQRPYLYSFFESRSRSKVSNVPATSIKMYAQMNLCVYQAKSEIVSTRHVTAAFGTKIDIRWLS